MSLLQAALTLLGTSGFIGTVISLLKLRADHEVAAVTQVQQEVIDVLQQQLRAGGAVVIPDGASMRIMRQGEYVIDVADDQGIRSATLADKDVDLVRQVHERYMDTGCEWTIEDFEREVAAALAV